MKMFKIPIVGNTNPKTGFVYVGKDEAITHYISQTPAQDRLVNLVSDYDYSSTNITVNHEYASVGYVCDIDYDRCEATVAIYYDDADLSKCKLGFDMIVTVKSETSEIIVDKIFSVKLIVE